MSDPKLKFALLKAMDRAQRYKDALKRIRKLVNAPRPINTAARMQEIGEIASAALSVS